MEYRCVRCGILKDGLFFYKRGDPPKLNGSPMRSVCIKCTSKKGLEEGMCLKCKKPAFIKSGFCKSCLKQRGLKQCKICKELKAQYLDFFDKQSTCKTCRLTADANTLQGTASQP